MLMRRFLSFILIVGVVKAEREERDLISIHDLQEDNSLQGSFRFQKVALEAKDTAPCGEDKVQMQITSISKFEERGFFESLFDTDNVDVIATMNPDDEADISLLSDVARSKVRSHYFCFENSNPSKIKIEIKGKRKWWFADFDCGTSVFTKNGDGWSKESGTKAEIEIDVIVPASPDVTDGGGDKASNSGATTEAVETNDEKNEVDIEPEPVVTSKPNDIEPVVTSTPYEPEPVVTSKTDVEETQDETKPFFWTCPGVNTGKNFDRIRKDYNELTVDERALYVQAINTAKERGFYDLFVAMHKYKTNDDFAHGTMAFLAWHRKFLLEFENMLRSLDKKFECVTIPFWDWAQEAKVCQAINKGANAESSMGDDTNVHGHSTTECNSYADVSHLIRDFGGKGEEGTIEASECCSGDCDCTREWCSESEAGMMSSFCGPRRKDRRWGSKPNGCVRTFGADNQCQIEHRGLEAPTGVGCVKTGPFKDWIDFEGRKCLVRGTSWDAKGWPMPGTMRIAQNRVDSKTIVEYMNNVYGPLHGSQHVQIAGHMSTMHSPQDPIFWSHHAFIDKSWWMWQDCHDAHDDPEMMLQTSGYGSSIEAGKNMPFCVSAKMHNFAWLDSAKHLPWIEKIPALKAAMEGHNPDVEDAFAGKDMKMNNRGWWCGKDGAALRVSSAVVPSWTDEYVIEEWQDSHKMSGEGNNVLYWPDDYDRHARELYKETCNFDKWGLAKNVDQATQDAMMKHKGKSGESDDTDLSKKETDALNFLEVSSKLSASLQRKVEHHHQRMWSPQQLGFFGNVLATVVGEEVKEFTEMVHAKVESAVKSMLGGEASSPSMDKVKKATEDAVKDVLDTEVKKECKAFADVGAKEHGSPLETFAVWIGKFNMAKTAKRCIQKPFECKWLSSCKTLALKESCTTEGCGSDDGEMCPCTGTCASFSDQAACDNSPTCAWLEMPERHFHGGNDVNKKTTDAECEKKEDKTARNEGECASLDSCGWNADTGKCALAVRKGRCV
eukprot:g1972.t1